MMQSTTFAEVWLYDCKKWKRLRHWEFNCIGGTLMVYGVYENKALVHWPPAKIFGDEITVCLACSSCCHRGPVLILVTTFLDHWFVFSDVLLPASGCIPRQQEDQCHWDGKSTLLEDCYYIMKSLKPDIAITRLPMSSSSRITKWPWTEWARDSAWK